MQEIDLHGVCNQKPIEAIKLEKQVIKLLYAAKKVWEKSVNSGSITKSAEEAAADLEGTQELYIRGEISKEIQLAYADWKELSAVEHKDCFGWWSKQSLCEKTR